MEVKKKCFKCGVEKPRRDFYRHPHMGDGLLGKCKTCTRDDVTKHRRKNVERIRQYDKQRSKLPHRKKTLAIQSYGYIRQFPVAYAARYMVSNAIRDGRLQRQDCEICGKRAQAHHDDYLKPLDIRWLCPPHHSEWHQKNGPGANLS